MRRFPGGPRGGGHSSSNGGHSSQQQAQPQPQRSWEQPAESMHMRRQHNHQSHHHHQRHHHPSDSRRASYLAHDTYQPVLAPRRRAHDSSASGTPISSTMVSAVPTIASTTSTTPPVDGDGPALVDAVNERSVDAYERLAQVGEGTYGKVYKARHIRTGELVALKRIRMESEKEGFPITAMREIRLLQRLQHPNILHLQRIVSGHGSVCMVFAYMDHDLTGILGHPTFRYRVEHVKCLLRQMLEGLAYMHAEGILHRDIKGSNILLNNRGELKLADFGLARYFEPGRRLDFTNRVITLWYRPPELLLGATQYGPEVDMWGVGCIALELMMKRPAFAGVDEISQLDAIYKVCGTPTEQTWPGMTDLPWFHLIKPREQYPYRLPNVFGKILSEEGLRLVERLLAVNPTERISAKEALASPYLTQEAPPPCNVQDLPRPDGDWHEYESKRRRKAREQQEKDRRDNTESKLSEKEKEKGSSTKHVSHRPRTHPSQVARGSSSSNHHPDRVRRDHPEGRDGEISKRAKIA